MTTHLRHDAEGPSINVPRRQVAVVTPDAIEADYRRFLLQRVRSARELLLDNLDDYLTGRRRDFNRRAREREDTRRDGTEREDIEALDRWVGNLRVQYGERWTEKVTRDRVEETTEQLDLFNENQNRRVIKSISGLDVADMGGFGGDTEKLLDEFARDNLDLVTGLDGLDEQVWRDTRDKLVEGVRKGVRHEAFAEIVEDRLGVAESRARLIARDQVQKLNSRLTQERQTSVGIERYRWSTAGDERVRPSHAAKAGEVFRWDDPPSDTGHPGDDIQCRCVAIPLVEEALGMGEADGGPSGSVTKGFESVEPADQTVSSVSKRGGRSEARGTGEDPDRVYDDWEETSDMVVQQEKKSCGAACARQLLRDREVEVDPEKLQGFASYADGRMTAGDVKRALISSGVDGNGWVGGALDLAEMDPDELEPLIKSNFEMPLIVAQGNHWIIVDDISDGVVKLRDPWGKSGPGAEKGVRAKLNAEDFVNALKGGLFNVVAKRKD